jgi:hypothetical protein
MPARHRIGSYRRSLITNSISIPFQQSPPRRNGGRIHFCHLGLPQRLVDKREYHDHLLELADGLYALNRRFRGTP